MADFFVDGRAIDWILGLVATEAIALLALRGLRGQGPAPLSFIGNLLSGAFLLLALRAALAGGAPATVGLCLAAALVAHLADLVARWESPGSAPRSAPMRATLSLRVSRGRARSAPRGAEDEPPKT